MMVSFIGLHNSHNYRTRGSENPHIFDERNFHPVKISIWIAISRRRIISPVFFQNTITAERCGNLNLQKFLQVHDDGLTKGL